MNAKDDLRHACDKLVPGADGPAQPASVKRLLRKLEADGLVRYQGGWQLTDRGRAVRVGK